MSTPDILLAHGYHLCEDPHEQRSPRPYPPLGLLYLSAHLKAAGFRVEIFDSTFARPEDLDRALAAHKPPVVGIYGNLGTRRSVVRAMKKARSSGARVVVGGPEPASYVAEYLEHGADVVVHGEGEKTLEELIPVLQAAGPLQVDSLLAVRGISFLDDREVVHTESREKLKDLDSQPWPDRAAIDIPRYLHTWRKHQGFGPVSLITARGCPYECQWCSHGVFGYSHRRRSPAGTADEVADIVDRYQPDGVWYADDVFTINYKWLREYSAELDQRGLSMPFETITREDRLNEEVVDILHHMACRRLWIGAESGSQPILDAMKRRTNAARMREMIALVGSRGIEVGTFIMLGYEGETEDDLRATVEHLKESLPDEVLTTVSYPIKGTPYYSQIEDRLVMPESWSNSTDRDVMVRGRRSPRYYRHAIRWMLGSVAAERGRRRSQRVTQAKGMVNAALGRAGMWLARGELEAPLDGGTVMERQGA